MNSLSNCPDCNAAPGEAHTANCDVVRCSACGSQRLSCGCGQDGEPDLHDPQFARWTGIWPGLAEAEWLGMDMNGLYTSGYYKILFVKPQQ